VTRNPGRTADWTVLDEPAQDTAALATKAAVADKRHFVTTLMVSNTGSGAVRAEFKEGGVVKLVFYCFQSGGAVQINLPVPYEVAQNTAVSLGVAQGAAGSKVCANMVGYTL